MAETTVTPKEKPKPTADDLHDMMGNIEEMEDQLSRFEDGMRKYNLASNEVIGESGLAVLKAEVEKVRSAIEWLGIIIGDAETDLTEREERDGGGTDGERPDSGQPQ